MTDNGVSVTPSSVNGSRSTPSTRSAISSGPAMTERPSASTTNSSPPRRPRVSLSRSTAFSRPATARSSWSPTLWPSVSLIPLKLSRSMKSTATGSSARRERESICSTRSRINARFGSPVSASCVAWYASSRWRSASSSCMRSRSSSNDSHMRTSVTSRLRWSIPSASDRAAGGVWSRGAAASSESATESRHIRQRLVASLSGAARSAARRPKMTQASRPTARASSGPPPATQRAKATVPTRAASAKSCSTAGSSTRREPCAKVRRRSTTSSVPASTDSPRRCRSLRWSRLVEPGTSGRGIFRAYVVRVTSAPFRPDSGTFRSITATSQLPRQRGSNAMRENPRRA